MKHQVILNSKGELVETLSALKYEFIKITENQNPHLLLLTSTAKGNGCHQLFKMVDDTLKDIIENDVKHYIKTYDVYNYGIINEPNELKLSIKVCNSDGFNNISFNDQTIISEEQLNLKEISKNNSLKGNQYSKSLNKLTLPVRSIFLYDPERKNSFRSWITPNYIPS